MLLGVGLVCLDIVNTVPHYPEEDGEVRIMDSERCRCGVPAAPFFYLGSGGNATNSLVVASQLGMSTCWLGTTMDPAVDADAAFLVDDLKAAGVRPLPQAVPGSRGVPTSYITLASDTGSRTIAHCRGSQPELTHDQFTAAAAAAGLEWSWVHFEGRHLPHTIRSAQWVLDQRAAACSGAAASAVVRRDVVVSVEVEKPLPDAERLLAVADVVFLSKEYATHCGHDTPEAILSHCAPAARPGALLVCPWGAAGALACRAPDGVVVCSGAFPPPGGVVDTLGAGDTFNAAMIVALHANLAVEDALTYACQVAGTKCGVRGLNLSSCTLPPAPVAPPEDVADSVERKAVD